MIIPFLAPFLIYLDMAIVFYPVVLGLIVLSILCLPLDLSPLPDRSRYETGGNPPMSVAFSVFMYAVVLYHFGINVGSWKHWLPLIGIYLVVGVPWATGKWWMYCGKVRDKVKEVVEKFKTTIEDDDNVDEVNRSFMVCMFSDSSLRKYKNAPSDREPIKPWPRNEVIDVFIPLVTEHKAIVLTWLFCWPISVLKWALADMLRDLYNTVFSAIKGAFQKIAVKRFSDI